MRSRRDGSLSAVKRSLAAFTGRADRERYLREVRAAAALPEHPHCVRYLRGWQQEQHFFVQMELCPGGSLAAVLAALPPGALLPEADVWRLARELASGLAHCHAHDVLHLDVKPGNVFLDDGAAAKLGDFGLAILTGRGWRAEEGDGAYVAPELLNPAAMPDGSTAEPTPAADVFSLGCTLLEAAGLRPQSASSSLELPAGRSLHLQELLRAMTRLAPLERPSAAQVHAAALQAERGGAD